MKIDNIKRMHRGWIAGHFAPTLYDTEDFEIAIHEYDQDSSYVPHYHLKSTEFNVILDGEAIVCGEVVGKDGVFIVEPGEVCDVKYTKPTRLLIFRNHSDPEDKYDA